MGNRQLNLRYCRPAMLVLVLALLLLCVRSEWVLAARYHVRVGGTRTEGVSAPGFWNFSNCYATIQAALDHAADVDTVLLFREDHMVTTALDLTTCLANQDLNEEYESCRILLTGQGCFNILGPISNYILVGITLMGVNPLSPSPALFVQNNDTLVSLVEVNYCCFQDLHGHTLPPGGGSAIAARGPGHGLVLSVNHSLFQNNSSAGQGGAVFVGYGFTAEFRDCNFINNSSASGTVRYGGALAVESPEIVSQLILEDCVFLGNQAGGRGGAIFVRCANCDFSGCDFTQNVSNYESLSDQYGGAGVYILRWSPEDHSENTFVNVVGCQFVENATAHVLQDDHVGGDGGGLFVAGLDSLRLTIVTVTECLFENNFNIHGAGLYLGRYTIGSVQRSVFKDNTAHGQGGAVFKGGQYSASQGETITLEYCLFQGNRAGFEPDGSLSDYPFFAFGGAVFCRRFPRVEILNGTFVDNYVGGEEARGDAFYHHDEGVFFENDDQRCRLANALFWGESGNDLQVRSDPDGFTEVTHCAWPPGEFYCNGVNPISAVRLNTFPFVALADAHLADESPCIDTGLFIGLTQDLDGVTVPFGPVPDIGCYEWTGPSPVFLPTPREQVPSLAVYPNPFNPRTNIVFVLERAQWIQLEILDLRGRLVNFLGQDQYSAGEHSVVWDGTDTWGRPVPSGHYLGHLSAGGVTVTRPLSLVR